MSFVSRSFAVVLLGVLLASGGCDSDGPSPGSSTPQIEGPFEYRVTSVINEPTQVVVVCTATVGGETGTSTSEETSFRFNDEEETQTGTMVRKGDFSAGVDDPTGARVRCLVQSGPGELAELELLRDGEVIAGTAQPSGENDAFVVSVGEL